MFVDENKSYESLDLEEINHLNYFISFDNELKIADTEVCNTKTLVVMSFESSLLRKNQSCSVLGDFIQSNCQIFLIAASKEVEINEDFYVQLKCNLVHQPFVFVFIPKNETNNYELIEVQVPTKKSVKLISWVTNEPPRLVYCI